MLVEAHKYMGIQSDFGARTVNELSLLFRDHHINLEPGFQRKSVWTLSDRRRLIQSIAANYPLPSIFLYKRNSKGKTIYDVIDGKQRLETVLMFTRQGRFKRDAFDVRLDLGNGLDWQDWREICRHHPLIRHAINTYKIQTVEGMASITDGYEVA